MMSPEQWARFHDLINYMDVTWIRGVRPAMMSYHQHHTHIIDCQHDYSRLVFNLLQRQQGGISLWNYLFVITFINRHLTRDLQPHNPRQSLHVMRLAPQLDMATIRRIYHSVQGNEMTWLEAISSFSFHTHTYIRNRPVFRDQNPRGFQVIAANEVPAQLRFNDV